MVSFLYFVSLEKRTESGFYWGQKQQLGAKKEKRQRFVSLTKKESFPSSLD